MPDLVIMDLSMPGMNGVETTRQITSKLCKVKVISLTMHSAEQFVNAAFEAGASGYLLKTCHIEELTKAIRTVKGNQFYLYPAIAGTVVRGFRDFRTNSRSSFSQLTSREREVLQLIAEGLSTRAIAARLHVSVKTIGTHREHVMGKLGLDSVAGLTKYAIRNGLTGDDPDFVPRSSEQLRVAR